MRNLAIALVMTLCGCGAPVLRDAPRADPAHVAVGAAAVATVLTAMDPAGHARSIEDARDGASPAGKPQRVRGATVPEDVLDRLDRRE
jgi:hypothetical protein